MLWQRANDTQVSLGAAEQHFLDVCNTDGEVSEAEVEAAYAAMQRAAGDADEALVVIKGVPEWAPIMASVLR